jgi:hypothetical protein
MNARVLCILMSVSYSHYITGSTGTKSGGHAGLASGCVFNGSLTNYEATIGIMFKVLDAAHPGGDPFWGNEGVSVSQWEHGGQTLVASEGPVRRFHTRADLEAFLHQNGIAF